MSTEIAVKNLVLLLGFSCFYTLTIKNICEFRNGIGINTAKKDDYYWIFAAI